MMNRLKMTAAEYGRFATRVQKQPDGCWLWVGYRNPAGYGEFNFAGKRMRAHRISYRHFNGEIPLGLFLDHTCSTKSCVNPAHLEPVTSAENTRRWAIKRFNGKCKKGHAREFASGKECGHCVSIREGRTWVRKFENVCKRGHLFTDENTYWVKTVHKGKEPSKVRLCKTCAQAKQKKQWATKKLLRAYLTAILVHCPFQLFPELPTTQDYLPAHSESPVDLLEIPESQSEYGVGHVLPTCVQEKFSFYEYLSY